MGVVLESGEEIEARAVLASTDARRTFLGLLPPGTLEPAFEAEVRRFRFRGSSGKVNLALDGLPSFTSLPGPGEHLRGAISFSPSLDYMEQAYDDAKAGRFSRRPYVDVVIPTLVDPTMAPPGKHVMSCFVQYAPYHLAEGTWDEQREAFGDAVVDVIAERAPDIRDLILDRQVVTPLDMERDVGLTEGNIFQGELSLEQLFFNRPVPGWSRFRTPVPGLWLAGSSAHPGGGIMGAPGRLAALAVLAERRAGRRQRMSRQRRLGRHRRRRRPQRPGLRRLPGAGRPAHAAPGAARGRRWGAPDTSEIVPRRARPDPGPHRRPPGAPGRPRAGPGEATACSSCSRPPLLTSVGGDGPPLTLWADPARTAAALRRIDGGDAEAWPVVDAEVRALAGLLWRLMLMMPPDPRTADPGRARRGAPPRLALLGGLGLAHAREVTRVLPQPVADFLEDRLDSDALRAAVATRALRYTAMGPHMAGTTAVLLTDTAGNPGGAAGRDRPRAWRPGRPGRGTGERGPHGRGHDPHGRRRGRHPGPPRLTSAASSSPTARRSWRPSS